MHIVIAIDWSLGTLRLGTIPRRLSRVCTLFRDHFWSDHHRATPQVVIRKAHHLHLARREFIAARIGRIPHEVIHGFHGTYGVVTLAADGFHFAGGLGLDRVGGVIGDTVRKIGVAAVSREDVSKAKPMAGFVNQCVPITLRERL
jgi:hypothetical protein